MNPAPPRGDYAYLPKGFGNKGCYTSCINYMYYIITVQIPSLRGGAKRRRSNLFEGNRDCFARLPSRSLGTNRLARNDSTNLITGGAG